MSIWRGNTDPRWFNGFFVESRRWIEALKGESLFAQKESIRSTGPPPQRLRQSPPHPENGSAAGITGDIRHSGLDGPCCE